MFRNKRVFHKRYWFYMHTSGIKANQTITEEGTISCHGTGSMRYTTFMKLLGLDLLTTAHGSTGILHCV